MAVMSRLFGSELKTRLKVSLIIVVMPSEKEKAKCKRKTRYSTDYEARESIKRVRTRHGAGKSLRVYHCPVCFGYHITSSAKH